MCIHKNNFTAFTVVLLLLSISSQTVVSLCMCQFGLQLLWFDVSFSAKKEYTDVDCHSLNCQLSHFS